jgi:hypothetical protein
MTQLVNNIQETEERPQDYTEVTITALKRKPKATKCSDHHTVCLSSYSKHSNEDTYKKIQRKIKDLLGENQFGFRRVKGSMDATEMLRIIREQTSE